MFHSKVSCEGHMTSKPSKICILKALLHLDPTKISSQTASRAFWNAENTVNSSRPLVEKMANSSFKTDHTVPLLEKAHALKAQQAARKAAEKGWFLSDESSIPGGSL